MNPNDKKEEEIIKYNTEPYDLSGSGSSHSRTSSLDSSSRSSTADSVAPSTIGPNSRPSTPSCVYTPTGYSPIARGINFTGNPMEEGQEEGPEEEQEEEGEKTDPQIHIDSEAMIGNISELGQTPSGESIRKDGIKTGSSPPPRSPSPGR